MNSSRKLQIAVVSGAMLLFIALLFADTTPPPKTKELATVQAANKVDIETVINSEKQSLGKTILDQASVLELKISNLQGKAKQELFDSLILLYDNHVKPAIAAYYTEAKNAVDPSPEGWAKTGNRYYHAVGFVKPENRSALYSQAMFAYEKALALQPGNLEIKTALAACYVEGSAEPMKGITMLREVIAVDSNNVKALLNLGMFAIKSGQTEKAIERFQKIISVDTTFIEAYLYLADCYERINNIEAAIQNLNNYQQRVDDVAIKTEVKSYINKLSQRKS